MDIAKLRTRIFEKTGVRVDDSDPIFTLVALNESLLEDVIQTFNDTLGKNNAELDERIGSIVVAHRQLIAAAENLVERANQAHMASALKAAAEAKKEIMLAAQQAVSAEVEKSATIISTAANKLADAGNRVNVEQRHRWLVASAQAVISGIVAGIVVIATMHFIH
jgi:predicted nuclease of restriction endonuclease-like RecB superfamily